MELGILPGGVGSHSISESPTSGLRFLGTLDALEPTVATRLPEVKFSSVDEMGKDRSRPESRSSLGLGQPPLGNQGFSRRGFLRAALDHKMEKSTPGCPWYAGRSEGCGERSFSAGSRI